MLRMINIAPSSPTVHSTLTVSTSVVVPLTIGAVAEVVTFWAPARGPAR